MSYAIPYDEVNIPSQPVETELRYIPRSKFIWLPFLLPVILCCISWMSGDQGLPLLTDLGFLSLTILCITFLLVEFFRFPQRFGVGGFLLFGGVLIWFCHDYFSRWFLIDYSNGSASQPSWVVCKAAALHMIFIMMMAIGLGIDRGHWAEKAILSVPEPGNENFYFWLMIALFAFGASPWFLFTKEAPWLAIYHSLLDPTHQLSWTVFRTGNLNFEWGAYVAQIIQVGEVGGILAITYAIVIGRSWIKRLIAVTIWMFWVLYAYQSARRGEMAFAVMPAVALFFVKYNAETAAKRKIFAWKAYLVCGGLGLLLLFVVQIQGTYRGIGLSNATLDVDITKAQGNTMFSEGLLGYSLIPDHKDFFANTLPLEGLIRPIPNTIFWFAIGPIPRALWNTKPIDPLWKWYNQTYTGEGDGLSGTTISHGLVGYWYFNYGIFGVLEGGLLLGWLMGVSERALRGSNGRPMGLLYSLAFVTWLFRVYRDFIFIELYPLLIGGVGITILVVLLRPFLQRGTNAPGFEVVQQSD